MTARGVRGATSIEENTAESIRANTQELLTRMMEANGLERDAVACAFFTTTRDLNADFPAAGARELGWTDVPLLCGPRDGRARRAGERAPRLAPGEHRQARRRDRPRLSEGSPAPPPRSERPWRRIEYTIGKRLVTETPREGRTEPE